MTDNNDSPPQSVEGNSNDSKLAQAALVAEADPPPAAPKSGKLSKSEPAALSKMFEMALGFTSSSGPGFHPLFEKFNDEHIHKFLDGLQKDDDHEYKLRHTNRIFHLCYTILGLIAFGLLFSWLLPNNKDLLVDILRIVIIFAGGLGAGFGLKSQLDKRKS